jgi:single-stranded-DNA-specific exonuclease
MLTLPNIEALDELEPCGNGCPKPVLMMEGLTVDRLQSVGNGKHLRLRLRRGRYAINAIYFSATAQSAAIAQGDLVDVAFNPQINEFRDERTVQMNILDIRPSCQATCSPELCGYPRLRTGDLPAAAAGELLPDRATLATVWRYLAAVPGAAVEESPMCLCRKIVRWSGNALSLGRMMVCLDIFCDVGLIQLQRMHKYISIRLTPGAGKADLNQSQTMQRLLQMKES